MRKINSNLWSLFWAQFCGALNDNVFKNALVILITFEAPEILGLTSPMLVALAGAIFIAPFFFLSATSGQVADLNDKASLVKLIKLIEIGIIILGTVAFFLKNYYLLFLVLFLLGVHSSFFGPLKYALIPHYSFKRDLVFSNALISGGTFVAILMGTIIGGLAQGIWLQSILIIIAVLGWFYSRRLPSGEIVYRTEEDVIDWHFFRSTNNILKITFHNNERALLALGLSWFWFLGAGLLSLLPLLAKDILRGDHAIATVLLFTFTLGMGIGPFVLEKLTAGQIRKIMIPISLLIMSLFIFDLSYVVKSLEKVTEPTTINNLFLLDNSWRLLCDLFFLSFFGGMYTVTQFSELQHSAPQNQISRIIAGNNVLNALFMVAVSLLIMLFFKLSFSMWLIFLCLGSMNLVAGFAMVFFHRKEFSHIS